MHCLSCAEMEELTPFEQAVLKGQNKHMQLLKASLFCVVTARQGALWPPRVLL